MHDFGWNSDKSYLIIFLDSPRVNFAFSLNAWLDAFLYLSGFSSLFFQSAPFKIIFYHLPNLISSLVNSFSFTCSQKKKKITILLSPIT